jgi:hypothetical protein
VASRWPMWERIASISAALSTIGSRLALLFFGRFASLTGLRSIQPQLVALSIIAPSWSQHFSTDDSNTGVQ